MGWNPTTKILTAPISLGDISTAVQKVSGDLGTLCTAPGINKWSKNKPIRYYEGSTPFTGILNDTQRRGMQSEILDGYIYGVQLAGSAVHFQNVHDISFEYHRPRGIAENEMFRALDFDGYAYGAVPTLSGYLPASGVLDSHAFSVEVRYDPNNTTGIDYAQVLTDAGYNIETMYPFVLVSNAARTKNYACALFNSRTNTVTTLKSGGAWYTDFYCKFNTMPGAATGTWLISLFLVAKKTGETLLDYTGTWKDVTGGRATAEPYGVPDCIAKNVTIQPLTVAPPVISFASARATTTGVSSTGTNSYVSGQSSTFYYRITLNAGGTDYIITGAGSNVSDEILRTILASATWAQLGIRAVSGQHFQLGIRAESGWTSGNYDSRSMRSYAFDLVYP